MARRTKKVGIAGTFGPRYGVVARKRYADISSKSVQKYICPRCNYVAVKRCSTGIWVCRHCGFKFAGGAYTPISREMGKMKTGAKERDYSDLRELVENVRAEMVAALEKDVEEGEDEKP